MEDLKDRIGREENKSPLRKGQITSLKKYLIANINWIFVPLYTIIYLDSAFTRKKRKKKYIWLIFRRLYSPWLPMSNLFQLFKIRIWFADTGNRNFCFPSIFLLCLPSKYINNDSFFSFSFRSFIGFVCGFVRL